MINENDILTMLQNGESADSIAQKLVDTLNSAKEKYDEELAAQAKADAEAKAKAAEDLEKQEDMADILDAVYQFVYKWYCENDDDISELDTVFASFTAKDAIKTIEDMGAMAIGFTKAFEDIDKVFDFNIPRVKVKPIPAKRKCVKVENTPDEIIGNFLKSIGL